MELVREEQAPQPTPSTSIQDHADMAGVDVGGVPLCSSINRRCSQLEVWPSNGTWPTPHHITRLPTAQSRLLSLPTPDFNSKRPRGSRRRRAMAPATLAGPRPPQPWPGDTWEPWPLSAQGSLPASAHLTSGPTQQNCHGRAGQGDKSSKMCGL
jgi:hypothetical protein